METALFYYHYSDRNPGEWNITVDKNTMILLQEECKMQRKRSQKLGITIDMKQYTVEITNEALADKEKKEMKGMAKNQKSYTPEFKQQIVDLCSRKIIGHTYGNAGPKEYLYAIRRIQENYWKLRSIQNRLRREGGGEAGCRRGKRSTGS